MGLAILLGWTFFSTVNVILYSLAYEEVEAEMTAVLVLLGPFVPMMTICTLLFSKKKD